MIKNIFRLNSHVTVTLDDGTSYESNNCTEDFYNKICKIKKDNTNVIDKLNVLFYPDIYGKEEKYKSIKRSSILIIKNGSAYMPEISNLTIPQMLAEKIAIAEENHDEDAITAYKNFWTLLSLNPNSTVRDNLFWFLDKWGMSICKSGLFVAYRNVELKSAGVKYNPELTKVVSRDYYIIKNYKGKPKDNPKDYFVTLTREGKYDVCLQESIEEDDVIIGNLDELYNNIIFCDSDAGTVYTDNRTRTFEIRLGHIVSMPRSEVDENPDNQCSRGLHIGGRDWLQQNYCGNIGIKVLVNPADVCATPKLDNYGKTRTCAYYPIQVINFKNGQVDDDNVPDGFEVDFINKISYTGTINNEDNDNYKLEIPGTVTKVNIENIYKSLKETASKINRKV